ncbi:MAG: hypothetical protein ABIN91_17725 [Mucilaginibacter sp.]|uniref:hypothetical protein n=1 Tax=Mucilaginibacter sp. TaxID=1882438 RepID=UPI003263C4CD
MVGKKIKLLVCIIVSSYFCFAKSINIRIAENNSAIRIMKSLYSSYDSKKKGSVWICNDTAMLHQYKINNKIEFLSKILSCDSLLHDGIKTYYSVISSVPNDDEYQCHECGAIEEFVVFNTERDNLKLVYKNQFAKWGSWGGGPIFNVTKVGDKFLYLFKPGTTFSGTTVENIMIYSFYNSLFKKLLFIKEAAKDNEGDCDKKIPGSCYGYNYTINFADPSKEYSDIILNTKGTAKKSGKIVSMASSKVYHFNNGQYGLIYNKN